MKFFRKICILVLIVVTSLTTCLLSSCDALKKEVITEDQAKNIVTEYFEIIKKEAINAGFTLDSNTATFQLRVNDFGDGKCVSSCLFFKNEISYFEVFLSQKLKKNRTEIEIRLYTNQCSLENDKLSNSIIKMLAFANLISERQFTTDEYVEFLTNDKYVSKDDYGSTTKCKFIDIRGNISFNFWELNTQNEEQECIVSPSLAKYAHSICSQSKKIV